MVALKAKLAEMPKDASMNAKMTPRRKADLARLRIRLSIGCGQRKDQHDGGVVVISSLLKAGGVGAARISGDH